MPFLTQGKTNWKYILIVLILAVVVSGVSFWLSRQEIPITQPLLPKVSKEISEQKVLELLNQILQSKCGANFSEIRKIDWTPESINADLLKICPEIEEYKRNKIWFAETFLNRKDYTDYATVGFVGIEGKFICVYAEARGPGRRGIKSIDTICQVGETANWKTYNSLDNILQARVTPVGKTKESIIEIWINEGKLLQKEDYTSEDGDHGLVVAQAEWTPDSQFFIYSMYSSGGHQPWYSRVCIYSRSHNKIYSGSSVVGFTIARDEFTVTAPDVVTFTVYTSIEKETMITKSFTLSERISTVDWRTYRNEEYGFEIKYPDIFTPIEKHLGFAVMFQPKEKYACNPTIKVFSGTVEEYLKSLESDPLTEIISKKDIFINNYKGVEIRSATYEMGLADICVLLPYNSKIYKMCACEESDIEDIFNQMLSTFRFLE